jgi:hypothetical protein
MSGVNAVTPLKKPSFLGVVHDDCAGLITIQIQSDGMADRQFS